MKSEDQRQNLTKSILPLLLKKGVKNLTMDYVAKQLGISKRTLYEIYESKDHMIIESFTYMHLSHLQRMKRETLMARNTMEGMVIAFRIQGEIMTEVDASLFRDMDELYPRLRPEFEKGVKTLLNSMDKAFSTGVEQGVFRPNLNYRIIMRLFLIQMESLKRMEKYFPDDVSLLEVYQTMSDSFLRGIATAKGLEVLEKSVHDNNPMSGRKAPASLHQYPNS